MAAQKRFIAHAAHELRSPLTKLYGELQLALRKERGAGEYRRAIEEAEGATRQLKHLAADLLTLARAQGAEENGVAEASPVEKLVSDAVTLVAASGEALDPVLPATRIDQRGDACSVHGRAADLVRLLRNLLENAAAHSPPEGRVVVDWSERAEHVEIRVSDEGEGVPENLRDRIFEPFFRGPGAGRARGTGLGLGIAREIARAHGGDVVLEDGEGGATFLVTLPLAQLPQTARDEKSP